MKHICGKNFQEKIRRKKKIQIERIQKIKNKITRTKIQKKERDKRRKNQKKSKEPIKAKTCLKKNYK